MLDRRRLLTVTGALAVSGPMVRNPVRHVATGSAARSRPAFDVPRHSCDAHVHVVANRSRFPLSPKRDYTPPTATASQLRADLDSLGINRVIVVAPTCYGTDNAATIDAIQQLGLRRARGVGWLDDSAPLHVLKKMRQAGIVGFRLLPWGDEVSDARAAALKLQLQKKLEIAQRLGWHIDIEAPPAAIAAFGPQLMSAPAPVVLDTFGWVAGGVDQPGFDMILSLLKSGRVYVKLSEPYRLSRHPPDYPDVRPVARMLIAANPDRILWGSGWPYVSGPMPGSAKTAVSPNLPLDSQHLLNLLGIWAPDADIRRRILVDNPERLYGF